MQAQQGGSNCPTHTMPTEKGKKRLHWVMKDPSVKGAGRLECEM